MKNNNVCKFVMTPVTNASNLLVDAFVLESDPAVIESGINAYLHLAVLPISGKGSFLIDGKEFPYKTGNLTFCFKGETFKVKADEKAKYLYIRFDGSRADELFRRFNISKTNRSFEGFDGLIPLWRESLSRADQNNVDLASESILLYTFSRLTVKENKGDNLVRRIVEITEENFTDPNLSLDMIADTLSYNPKYLSHTFKEKMGVGYSKYLRSLRLKYAVSLFEHGIDSVKNVALLSGFSDPLYFSTVFKKEIGLSPTVFIKQ